MLTTTTTTTAAAAAASSPTAHRGGGDGGGRPTTKRTAAAEEEENNDDEEEDENRLVHGETRADDVDAAAVAEFMREDDADDNNDDADDDNNEDDDENHHHHEELRRFEREQRALFVVAARHPPPQQQAQQQAHYLPPSQPPPPSHYYSPAVTLRQRQARATLGYNPLAIVIAGWPWSPLQYAAFGAQYTYGACRERHEQTYCFVRFPFDGVGQLVSERDTHLSAPTATTTTTMRILPRVAANAHFRVDSRTRGLCYMRRCGEDKELVAKRFVDAWLSDPDARTLDGIVFDPSMPSGYLPPPRNTWNNWPGLAAEKLSRTAAAAAADDAEEDDTDTDEDVRLILDHIHRILCSSVREHSEWLLDYFAIITQRPWAKTGVCLIFSGVQGAGKNTILDFFRLQILGPRVTAQLQNPRHGLFGRFDALHEDKIFVQIDEAKKLGVHEDAFKNLITDANLNLEQKFGARYTKPNLTNAVITSNEVCPAELPPGERRYTVFRVCPDVVGNAPYFDRLHAALRRPEVAVAFYRLLMGRTHVRARFGEHGNLQASRPITAYYLACRRRCLDALPRFLSAIANQRAYTDHHKHQIRSSSSHHHHPHAAAAAAAAAEVRIAHLYQDYQTFFVETGAGRSDTGAPKRLMSLVAFTSALAMLCPGLAPHLAPLAYEAESPQATLSPASSSLSVASSPAMAVAASPPHPIHDHNHHNNDEAAAAEIDAITRRSDRGGFIYMIDYGRLKAMLSRTDEYDADAFLLSAPHVSAPIAAELLRRSRQQKKAPPQGCKRRRHEEAAEEEDDEEAIIKAAEKEGAEAFLSHQQRRRTTATAHVAADASLSSSSDTEAPRLRR
jgi:hypothetical protein